MIQKILHSSKECNESGSVVRHARSPEFPTSAEFINFLRNNERVINLYGITMEKPPIQLFTPNGPGLVIMEIIKDEWVLN